MKYEIVFTQPAYNDLKLAFEWYEQERHGLGWEFRNEIAICIDKISDTRISYAVFQGSIRRIPVARFPYVIYFKKFLRKRTIVIAAVLHERRNPETIKKRIKK